jgi:hypothetical protein
MEGDSEMTDEAGTKREIHDASEMDGGRRTSRKTTQTEDPSALGWTDASAKRAEERNMELFVAKWNADNPDSTPLVLEELSEQQRASLEEEVLARDIELGEAYAARMRDEDMARVEEESRDPNEDNDDRVYQQYRERWEWKTAKQFGSFEDRSKLISPAYALITSVLLLLYDDTAFVV